MSLRKLRFYPIRSGITWVLTPAWPLKAGKLVNEWMTRGFRVKSKIEDRARGCVVGGLIADAATAPIDRVDTSELDKHLTAHGQEKYPEFLSIRFSGNQVPAGRFSCYGDQTYALLTSLVEKKGFDSAHYEKSLNQVFGAGSFYDHAINKGPGWRPTSLEHFVMSGKSTCDSQGFESDAFVKVAPLVALYAGKENLLENVEKMVRVTQDNDTAVVYATTAARMLECLILFEDKVEKRPLLEVEEKAQKELRIKVDLDKLPRKETDTKFEHDSESTLESCFRLLERVQEGDDYQSVVREVMTSGGDKVARANFIGCFVGAANGFSELPQRWINRTTKGRDLVELADKLMEIREEIEPRGERSLWQKVKGITRQTGKETKPQEETKPSDGKSYPLPPVTRYGYKYPPGTKPRD